MPDSNTPNEVLGATPQEAREEAQLLLANIHGLMWLAIQDAGNWYGPTTAPTESQLKVDDLRRAVEAGHARFGAVQAAISTGEYDKKIQLVGIGGPEGQAKKKGFMSAFTRYLKAGANVAGEKLAALKESLKWSKTIVGSINSAVRDEIQKVHGASFLAEGIGELLEVLQGAAETVEKRIGNSNQPAAGGVSADYPKQEKQEKDRKEKGSTEN
jgi:hypothetical protein